jgi:hypothetical protein
MVTSRENFIAEHARVRFESLEKALKKLQDTKQW